MAKGILHARALHSLHAGTGQSVDAIDLPIARERATDLPLVPASSVKGVLRAECIGGADEETQRKVEALFGPDKKHADEYAGAAVFSDLRLLLFPVRSASRLFAWVTSPYLLRRYDRARARAGLAAVGADALAEAGQVRDEEAFVSDATFPTDDRIYLDDLDLTAMHSPGVEGLAGALGPKVLGDDADLLKPRLVVLSDTMLSVLASQATEVVARISIGNSGTAEGQALWYEEALPGETVLYGEIVVGRPRKGDRTPAQLFELLSGRKSAQFGGKASVGRGLCALSWERGGAP